jgi:hypothetical protein
MSKKVSAEALFKALDDLENQITKGTKSLPKSTKEANGGLASMAGGEGDEADVDAEGEDSEAKSLTDEEDVAPDEDEKEPVAKAVKAAKDEESDESESDEASEDEKSDDETSKSMREELEENEEIAKGLEVSSFLEQLVDTTASGVDRLNKSIKQQGDYQHDFNVRMSKALTAIGGLLTDMQEQLSGISDAPATSGPRSQFSKSITAAQVETGSQNRFEGEDAPEFSKSEVLESLITLAQKGEIHPVLVTQFESTGSLPAEIAQKVEQALRRQ